MSDSSFIDPVNNPELAAHEVVLELIKSEALIWPNDNSYGSRRGDLLADTAIAAHKKLVEYYKTLE